MTKKQKKVLVRILISFVLTVVLNLFELSYVPKLTAFLAVYLVIGYDILRKAFRGIVNGRIMDENFLMAIATVGAFALSIYSGSGDYNEAVAVMLFYQTGELFQSCAVHRSRKNISSLMNIRPDYANIEVDGVLTRVSPYEVEVGTVITVQPGERVAIDGIVAEGDSTLDTSSLTGESVPVSVKVGSEVLSGCINLNGILKIRTTKKFGDSTVSKILELVENATSRKSQSERFISKFAKVYTPFVCICALCLAIVPPVFMLIKSGEFTLAQWIYRALTFLVISCPCALVISIPLSFFACIGGLSREGILVKGSNFLEVLSDVRSVAFDKTGTLTEGSFKVNKIICREEDKERLIELAAMAECVVSHPIARSICALYSGETDLKRISDVDETRGEGVTATVDGISVSVGSGRLMKSMMIDYPECTDDGTIVYVSAEGRYLGTIVISDVIKDSSREAISSIGKLGIQTAMLTGDRLSTAENVAKSLGIDQLYSELLPADKVSVLEGIIDKTYGATAFAGDGVNDAPVLARADVGIAMGSLGSDAAIEVADVVIMDDDPRKIARAIKYARKCMKIVKENIIFSIAVKFICLALVAMGFADMWLGIFADVGVMVIAVLNSIRAFKARL